MPHIIETDIQYLKGAGPARKKLLAKLGIETIEDLLLHKPRAYLDRSRIQAIASLRIGQEATVEGTIQHVTQRRTRRRMTNVHALLTDYTGSIQIVWFNQPYLRNVLKSGTRIFATGQVRSYRGLQMLNPEFDIVGTAGGAGAEGVEWAGMVDAGPASDIPDTTTEPQTSLSAGRIVPVYPLTAGITQRAMRKLTRTALDKAVPEITDPLPDELIEKLDLPGVQDALENLHFPQAAEQAQRAHRRLAFDELFFLQVLLSLQRKHIRRPRTAKPLKGPRTLIKKAYDSLPFELTKAQKRALKEILEDLSQDRPMNRLLEGDVGSGKTVVAVLAAIAAAEAGSQTALMAPTEILVQQHARTASEILDPLHIPFTLLLGRTPAKAKREAAAGLAQGHIQLAIGTHALIQEGIEFAQLDLVIVDEQQRFGVLQRARLLGKGRSPHGLIMTATPIPRTLALTVYGDLDMSILDEKPPGRLPVRTHRVPERKRDGLLTYLAREIGRGCQVYVVCPMIEETEEMDLKAATETAERLRAHPRLAGLAVGLLHGRMKSDEKDRIMQDFRAGRTHILVTTTVVEVGVDVPNANIMVIEHPERYGLSQLHQLRGRVGRGRQPAHLFLMVGTAIGDESRERIDVLVRESDGFRIAEEDLRLRGPGDFFGVAQSGLPTLRIANLQEDADLVVAARREAQEWLASKPARSHPQTQRLMQELHRRYRDRAELFRVG